ncbi:MAG: FAD-dependent oxidoreductase [Xanthomonadales bacterium]|nr:FAD-dependent oxidoreductase [Xanthomonadales bacterium]
MQRIAIVGAGIAGLTAAWLLSRRYRVDLFEASDYAGGHTHTHQIEVGDRSYPVDSGFIVFNPDYYPLFCRLLEDLGVGTRETEMSFSVRNDRTGLQYNATDLPGLFCQRRNLVRPAFWRMLRDIARFYREAPALLQNPSSQAMTTGRFLETRGYSEIFATDHLIPMASALWSAPPDRILAFPIQYMVRFFANHRMLQMTNRPPWRTVEGGSQAYVRRLLDRLEATIHLATPVRSIARSGHGLRVRTDTSEGDYDRVVLACHSDQALAMLEQPSDDHRAVLGAMPYQRNDVVLHTDTSVLPASRRGWAAWNARIPRHDSQLCMVTYDMNILQGHDAPLEFLVTLNQDTDIDPARVLRRMTYHHPVYTTESVAAQGEFDRIDGMQGLHFCGAYWGWGFHEDGVRSAARVAHRLGVAWDD